MTKKFKELDTLRKGLTTQKQKDQFKKAKEQIEEYLEDEGFDDETPEYENTINAGIGEIHWKSDNIQLQYIMEAVEEKLKTTSPNDIVAILTS